VIVKQDDLINEIKGDHRRQLRTEEPLSFNCYTVNDNPDQSTTGLNGHFIHSLLLIDVLIRMKSANSDKKALIKLCKEKYQTKKRELTQVRDFEYEYSAEKAVWWYTRESFLHKMLNEALRVQDIDLLFLFRFVIADIYEQLEKHKCRSAVRVYRGQFMSNDELDRLRRSKGEFISNNSFFSTTKNIEIARGFSEHSPSSNNLQQVLFIIDADPSVDTSKLFADIKDLSDNPHEEEVLFMIGCLFRLNDIHRDTEDGKTWKIRMKLCGDKENDLKNLFDHMKKEYGGGDGNVTPLSYADVLREMGKYELAEKIYHRLHLELSSDDLSLFDLYWSLGMLKNETGHYDDGMMWFFKALEIYNRNNLSDYVSLGNLYNWIGEMNRLRGQNYTALKYFNDAVVQFKTAHNEDHSSMGNIYNNIAIVYREQKNYPDALQFYKKSLKIRLKHLPENHPDIASSYNNIGNVNFDLQRYDLAMQCYQTALKMYIKSCPAQHSDIGMSYQNIGCVHQIKYEWKEAMENYRNAANIYRHSLASDHPNVIQIEKDIKYVSSKLK
jgi:tetratricopeptide (TPR) repeat protein